MRDIDINLNVMVEVSLDLIQNFSFLIPEGIPNSEELNEDNK